MSVVSPRGSDRVEVENVAGFADGTGIYRAHFLKSGHVATDGFGTTAAEAIVDLLRADRDLAFQRSIMEDEA